MIDLKQNEVWFITGSQHLYGEETLKQVDEHSKIIAEALNKSSKIPVTVVFKPVLKTPEEIYNMAIQANSDAKCIGLICWMHTFSPSKMWINGLKILRKPLCHLHTQFNAEIPYADIDMDFMNLNQSAHGDREFGFIGARMGIARKVVVGHWQDEEVHERINVWSRVASGWNDLQGAKFARFGDNMRFVAVTEGDKVEAEIKFGYSVNTHPVGDLVGIINSVSDAAINALIEEYEAQYTLMDSLKVNGGQRSSLIEIARIEAGLRSFLTQGNFKGYTNTFEDLHGMVQLPGIASQRLMADGYGYGGEGDWKTSVLVRTSKVMAAGLVGGTSFMEDYTYHFSPNNNQVLGSHMLEICPTIASGKPTCEIHPLGIGGKADPVRLVFNSPAGPALNASMVDMGGRFRLIVNEVEAIEPAAELPKLPVARVLWKTKPDLKTAAQMWILAGGAHHTVYSQALTQEFYADFAEIAGIEYVLINDKTDLYQFKNELRWNSMFYRR
ncbi:MULTISPECIES: L-arabinose isomerase [unclassified Arcicella]|uniref:L-arabinose isomerase n=1 Tax=unclassified Arcicella TaxID=2644986 RepID=UPI00285AA5A5|nr:MULTISPECIES: L-arabinose isomerase [unclassified Arcicella]MDR6561668.1 L-arabinose isomerase [Arcicella sp. BE51]MDR6812448.1 L-arabinose isomerase [Arcicella sp. BE140]MDR6823780.1 L-arabinose isomerase [Arcicella sp. BE139]